MPSASHLSKAACFLIQWEHTGEAEEKIFSVLYFTNISHLTPSKLALLQISAYNTYLMQHKKTPINLDKLTSGKTLDVK